MVKRYCFFLCLTLALLVACVDDKSDSGFIEQHRVRWGDSNHRWRNLRGRQCRCGFVTADGRLGDSGARPADGSLSDAQQEIRSTQMVNAHHRRSRSAVIDPQTIFYR